MLPIAFLNSNGDLKYAKKAGGLWTLQTVDATGTVGEYCALALDSQALAGCGAVFDRAALIALPPALRERYAHTPYSRLPRGCRGLLITLEYPPHEKQGPPFTVPEAEVRQLFSRDWDIDLLERRDILDQQPRFIEEGVTALATAVYRLERR